LWIPGGGICGWVSGTQALRQTGTKFVGSISSAPVFALDVYALAGVNSLEHETVAQAFEVHKVVMRQGKNALGKL
jgi:hypothetical protein